MPDQCYFVGADGKGDFYQCLIDTVPGESPATHPEKWCKIQLPRHWRHVLATLTYAGLLEADGQTEKAAAMRQNEEGEDRTGLEDLVRMEVNREASRRRPRVQTPYNSNAVPIVGLAPLPTQPVAYPAFP